MRTHQPERHRYARIGWLRAAVLGANDGIVSVASILLGVAAATSSQSQVAVAGAAALVAGAMAMAAGEFVSVSSQRDTELADIARERREILQHPDFELAELQEIYQRRGLDRGLAREVAQRLMEADPLGAHLRDELGMTGVGVAAPVQAAVSSAVSFSLGGALPLAAALVLPSSARIPVVAGLALLLLAGTGALGGRFGGAPVRRAALRVLAGGSLAMLVTWAIGALVGAAV
ncbi:MAG TPA: VIT1/CCC1 transporter family protein [Acidimicrobiia bacterium]|jgi:VIT1/CCC1 family predicted Fe2+/Mn2+ transporter|nr:VIT1/CCC1 transporter family protein [Acidimicrobiia bacterium]HEV3451657.1 VIT1/CCC1 transporter family protein [Acidimicrobiia bacterium]